MGMYGADADQLDQLAAQLQTMAGRLDGAKVAVGRQVASAPWQGRSADRFRQQWSSEYGRSMVQAAHFLRDAGDTLRRNANEQRHASGAGGSVGGSFTPCRPSPEHHHHKSWWSDVYERWMNKEFDAPLNYLAAGLRAVAHFGGLGEKILGPFGCVFDAVMLPFMVDDLFNSHPYKGAFDWLESSADVIAIGGAVAGIAAGVAAGAAAIGLIATAPAWVPVVAAGAAIAGVAAAAIDLGLEAWNHGGREWWRKSASPALHDAWNTVRSEGTRVISSATRTVTNSAQHVAATASHVLHDVGRGLSHLSIPRVHLPF